MPRIRVLVVEDSLTVRKRIVEVLAADPGLEVIAEAEDGKQAIELCQRLRPDVLTLDMMLPVMTGLAATEFIMAYCPTPILIVSASTNRGELFRTYEALAAGAVEVFEKPSGNELDDRWARTLVSTVKLVSRIKVITHPRGRLNMQRAPSARSASTSSCRALAIGASTGGPAALVEILKGMPPDYRLPILLVIHIAPAFDGQSALRVRYAQDGEPLPKAGEGRVIIAVPDRHMVLRHGRLWLTDDPERHSCRPSVDVLFESVALELGDQAAACILTGMGKDGAAGLLAIRQAGGTTLAQDEATSVVFGMPREAILLGAAGRVLPLDQIAPALTALGPGPEDRP